MVPEDNSSLLQHEIEQLLFHEADLIDQRRFDEWLQLFADDAVYCVPNAAEDAPTGEQGFIILEDRRGIADRVRRLQHPAALTQVPPPRTRHMITNVRVASGETGEVAVSSNQVVYFARQRRQVNYPGSWEHVLSRSADGWRIRRKTVFLLTNDQAMSQIPVL
jgi:3-phenylpropionate/cinnamic acid dioxygenase small subunit